MLDMLKKVADKAEGLGEVKNDVILLHDEANAIMREIGELQKVTLSLMMRQAKVMAAITRLKGLAGID